MRLIAKVFAQIVSDVSVDVSDVSEGSPFSCMVIDEYARLGKVICVAPSTISQTLFLFVEGHIKNLMLFF